MNKDNDQEQKFSLFGLNHLLSLNDYDFYTPSSLDKYLLVNYSFTKQKGHLMQYKETNNSDDEAIYFDQADFQDIFDNIDVLEIVATNKAVAISFKEINDPYHPLFLDKLIRDTNQDSKDNGVDLKFIRNGSLITIIVD